MSRFRAALSFARRRGIPMVSWEQVRASKLGLRLEVLGVFGLLKDYLYVAKSVTLVTTVLGGFVFCLLAAGKLYFFSSQLVACPSPDNGLTYTTEPDALYCNEFRSRAISYVFTPTLEQLQVVRKIREDTQGGTFKPPTLERDLAEVRNRLQEIMTEARLCRVPIEFRHQYEPSLSAIRDAYYSTIDLEEYFAHETQIGRTEKYDESIIKWKLSQKQCRKTRDFFMSDDWRNR